MFRLILVCMCWKSYLKKCADLQFSGFLILFPGFLLILNFSLFFILLVYVIVNSGERLFIMSGSMT